MKRIGKKLVVTTIIILIGFLLLVLTMGWNQTIATMQVTWTITGGLIIEMIKAIRRT